MIDISDKQFEKLVADGIDAIPEPFRDNIENVVFVVEDEPNDHQRHKLELRHNQTLFGLYEGIPLTARGGGYNMVLPDKITIFKRPMQLRCHTLEQLRAEVKHTVWHEVAHYFGLDHDRIYELERKGK